MASAKYQDPKDVHKEKGILESGATAPPPDAKPIIASSSSSELKDTSSSPEPITSGGADYAPTHAALVDKYILSQKNLPFILALVFAFFVIGYDNYRESISNWGDIWWSCQKASIPFGFAIIYSVLGWLLGKLRKK